MIDFLLFKNPQPYSETIQYPLTTLLTYIYNNYNVYNLVYCFSLLTVIVATEDNTQVEVSINSINMVSPFVLDRGEVFQYLGEPGKRLTLQGEYLIYTLTPPLPLL